MIKKYYLNIRQDIRYRDIFIEIENKYNEAKYRRTYERQQFYANIKVKKKNIMFTYKKEMNKEKNVKNQLMDNFNNFYEEFMHEYNNNITLCKYANCRQSCHNDVGYCLKHYPDICEQCNHICNKLNDKMDVLQNNTLYKIHNLCKNCAKDKYYEHYINNYVKSDILGDPIDEEDFSNILKTVNYRQFLINLDILKSLKEKQYENNLKKYEITDLCMKKEIYSYFDMKPNDFTRWQIYRQLVRTSDLVETFGDKLKYIKITQNRFRRMGYLQYQAFKEFICKILFDKSLNEYIIDNITNKINNIPTFRKATNLESDSNDVSGDNISDDNRYISDYESDMETPSITKRVTKMHFD